MTWINAIELYDMDEILGMADIFGGGGMVLRLRRIWVRENPMWLREMAVLVGWHGQVSCLALSCAAFLTWLGKGWKLTRASRKCILTKLPNTWWSLPMCKWQVTRCTTICINGDQGGRRYAGAKISAVPYGMRRAMSFHWKRITTMGTSR